MARHNVRLKRECRGSHGSNVVVLTTLEDAMANGSGGED
jgi:hypothetical protein